MSAIWRIVVMIAGQEPENSLENAALGPSVEALIAPNL
jgi:hypothetical protein